MITLDRLAFLCLWAKCAGMSEGNVRKRWNLMDEDERREVYAWAVREMTPTEEKAA